MFHLAIGISFFLFAAYAMLILYYVWAWFQAPVIKPASAHFSEKLLISVVIPARNEAANIQACLDSLYQQSLPRHMFEVLVVDDCSTDFTGDIAARHPVSPRVLSMVQLNHLPPTHAHKKQAITQAIAIAKGELMVTTDADCLLPPHWLSTIAHFYQTHQPAFIAMPVLISLPPHPSPATRLLHIFQQLDFMVLQGITAASVQQKAHSMCNGANLAYTRAAFFAVNGFEGIDHIASGDDMLLMHKIYQQFPQQVYYLKSPAVIVQTAPVPNLQSFFQQRIRWASKASLFTDKRITAVLALVYFYNTCLLLMMTAAFFSHTLAKLFLVLLLGKTLVELMLLLPVARFFNTGTSCWYLLPAQPFHILYTVIAGWLGKFGSYQWKGRAVK
jgi:cellulose synthase/poly-beta-1,6-N-acetylglucosamine synthase-like glycosyltransferase